MRYMSGRVRALTLTLTLRGHANLIYTRTHTHTSGTTLMYCRTEYIAQHVQKDVGINKRNRAVMRYMSGRVRALTLTLTLRGHANLIYTRTHTHTSGTTLMYCRTEYIAQHVHRWSSARGVFPCLVVTCTVRLYPSLIWSNPALYNE